MNKMFYKKNSKLHISEETPPPETTEVSKTIRVSIVSVILVGICLALIGIFFMSCGLFHVSSVGEALLTFDSNLFS